MSRIGMLTFPAIRSDGKNFVSNIKRNTKHSRVRQKHSTRAPAGLPGVEHQTQNAARNHVHRCPPSNHVQPETQVSHISQGDRNEPSPKAPSSKPWYFTFHEKNTKKKPVQRVQKNQDAAVEAVGPITMFFNCAHCKANCTGAHIEVSMRTDPELQSHLAIFP